MNNKERYDQLISELPKNNYRPGDVVMVYDKPRLVTEVFGGLVKVGKGRGHSMMLSVSNVTGLVVRNLKLKPGVRFCGVAGELIGNNYRRKK